MLRPAILIRALASAVAGLVIAGALSAQGIHLREDGDPEPPSWIMLPYVFGTESLGTAVGAAGGTAGHLQPSTRTFVTGYVTNNDSYAVLAGLSQLRIADRWFVESWFSTGRYTQDRIYKDPPGVISVPRPGSNESSPEQSVVGENHEIWWTTRLQYILPIGHGRDKPLAEWRLRDGFLIDGASGAESWNPFESGRSKLELRPFYRENRFQEEQGTPGYEEAGVAAMLQWDNRDYPRDASRGTLQRLQWKQAFGLTSDSEDWTSVEAEFAGYIPLHEGDSIRRIVLALDAWTAYSPSWSADGSGQPPFYNGARLGGFYRMRGFDNFRFYDAAAIYGCAELRLTPKWNPLRGGILKPLDIDWLQFVGFGEIGRVSPVWNLEALTTDMRWDVGVSLRAMIRRSVVRVDAAWSEEDLNIWLMVGDPFGLL